MRLTKATLGDKNFQEILKSQQYFQAVNVTVTMDKWNIVYLSLSTRRFPNNNLDVKILGFHDSCQRYYSPDYLHRILLWYLHLLTVVSFKFDASDGVLCPF